MSDRVSFSVSKRALVRLAAIAALVGGGYVVGVARAGVPADADALVYTGVLEESGVLASGDRAIAIELFAAENGGAALCRVAPGQVAVSSGRFRIPLTADCAVAVRASGGEIYVEVRVADVPVGARTRMGAVPFSLEAAHSSIADTALDARNAEPSSALADILAAQPIVSEWAPFTTTFRIANTPVTSGQATVGFVRRVGDSVELRVHTQVTNAAGLAAGAFSWDVPPGIGIDYAKLPDNGFNAASTLPLGAGKAYIATTDFSLTSFIANNNQLFLSCDACNGAVVSTSVPAAVASSATYSFEATLPVIGYSATRGP